MVTKTMNQLKVEISDLDSRLSFCSNTGEGRKVRREIERVIKQKEQEMRLAIENQDEFCFSDRE